jgi:serine/threonine-protein kinase HipA
MRKGLVYRNQEAVGELIEVQKNSYEFRYNDDWFNDSSKPVVSLTLPKTQQVYQSDVLFPFFFNLLSEGVNRQLQARQLKIDENDYFGLLLATAGVDTIGAVSVKPNSESK